ncbi:alpha/beta hydrolase [Bacillus timonensis]|nr:alpha/beta hydrolase [Bacillus timonensis]
MRKFLITLATIFTYVVSVGTFFSSKVMYIKKKSDEEILQRELTEGRFTMDELSSLQKEELTIPSRYGYKLHGWFVPTSSRHKFMIICHGVTVNKLNSIKYMKLFLERGWNVIVYDHRRHGQTGGKTTSYGHYEKFDLETVVHWVKNQFGHDITLGIHGESMGAVTTLLYAGMIEDGASFYIADCPFSDFEAQLRYRLKVEYNIPSILIMPIANLFLKIRDGYSLKDISPLSVVKYIKKPVLFIHSSKDDYILPEMTKELYSMKQGSKKLFIAPKGAHAYSYGENKSAYEQAIDEFLYEYVK